MLSPGLPWFCGTVGTSEATRWKQTFSDRVSGHLHATVPTHPGCPGPAPDLWTRLRGSPGTPRVMGVCLPRHATSAEGAPHGSPKCPPVPASAPGRALSLDQARGSLQSGRTSSLSCPWDCLAKIAGIPPPFPWECPHGWLQDRYLGGTRWDRGWGCPLALNQVRASGRMCRCHPGGQWEQTLCWVMPGAR